MKVRMLISSRQKPGAELDPPGKVVSVSDPDGKAMIKAGYAEALTSQRGGDAAADEDAKTEGGQ